MGVMSTVDARRLTSARQALRDHARDLIDPQTAEIERDDGTVTRHVGASLLAQLRAAVATGTETTPGRPGRGRPLVIATNAHDLLTAIAADVADWPWSERGPSVDARIRGCVDTLCRSVDIDAMTHVDRCLVRWAVEIRALLTPERRRHLSAPCPACDARMAWVNDPSIGERVQIPALQIAHAGPDELQCTCMACGYVWPASHFELLAGALGTVA